MHLTTGNSIRGKAGTSTAITYTINGTSLGNGVVVQALSTGQLPTSIGVLYTAPDRVTEISTIILANTTTSDVAGVVITLNGSSPTNQIIGELTIPAKGTATFSGGEWTVIDENGSVPVVMPAITLSGDATGTLSGTNLPVTLNTVNSTTGTFGNATNTTTTTVNGKGLVTSIANTPIQITESQVTNLTTDLAAKQPLNSNLTTIAGLTPSTDSFIQAKAGAWSARTIAQVMADLGLPQTTITGNAATATALQTGRTFSISADGTGTSSSFDGTANVTIPLTLSTVNSNIGSFGSSTSIPSFTVNAKGLITAASGNAVIAPASTLTGTTLASNILNSSLTSVGTLSSLTVTAPIVGSLLGNASTSTALATGRTIGITGDLTYTSPAFDGSGNVTGTGTLTSVNSNTGTFGSATQSATITLDAKGRATSASNTPIAIAQSQVTNLTSDLALKANLISPSFTTPSLGNATASTINTGTTLNGTIFAKSTNDITLASTNHALTLGDEASSTNLALGEYSSGLGVQARNNGAAAAYYINPLGGDVRFGFNAPAGVFNITGFHTGTGTTDYCNLELRNGSTISADAIFMRIMGVNFTSSSMNIQDAGVLGTGTNISGGLSIGTQASADVRFYTNNTLRTTIAAATGNISTSGQVVSTGGGIGYATGAGGTVTQGTSRSTGVTLNKLCGTITMFSAAQASQAVVTFTLTNSFIEATDFIQVQHISATNGGAWGFSVVAGAGSCTISVRNQSTASITEATPLHFVIIKAATS